MKRECRECLSTNIKIIGTGYLGDTIQVECPDCGEFYEIESDGFGEGGMEWVEAKCKDENIPFLA